MLKAFKVSKSLPTRRTGLSQAALFATALVMSFSVAPASAQTLSQVIFKGASAPDGVSSYRNMHRPQVGDAVGSSITFRGKIRNVATGSSKGVYIEDALGGSIVALSRDPAPTIPLTFYRRFEKSSINAAGNVTFRGSTNGTSHGIYRSAPLSAVSLAVDLPPPPLAGQIHSFGFPEYTDNQGIIFRASLFGAASVSTPAGSVSLDEALLRCHLGNQSCHNGTGGTGVLETLLTKNDPVPDRPGRFICKLPEEIGVSDFGVVLRAPTKLDCGDLLESPVNGIFKIPFGGALETVALVGEQATIPPLTGMNYIRLDGVPKMDAAGTVAFLGRAAGPVKEDGVYSCVIGFPCLSVVREGALDGSGMVNLSRFKGIDIADGGDIVFQTVANQPGYFTGINRGLGVYIYRSFSGTLERVAVKGDPAPDTLPATFRRIYLPDSSPGGRVTFRAKAKRAAGGGGIVAMYLYD